jgi:hypothetical protein
MKNKNLHACEPSNINNICIFNDFVIIEIMERYPIVVSNKKLY